MSEQKTARDQARAAGAKMPADRKKAASAKIKALQAEAADGDIVIEFYGEPLTVHRQRFNDRMTDDYEFMEIGSAGVLPPLMDELVGSKGHKRLKDLARDEDTGKVSTERMAELFQEVQEAAGQGNS